MFIWSGQTAEDTGKTESAARKIRPLQASNVSQGRQRNTWVCRESQKKGPTTVGPGFLDFNLCAQLNDPVWRDFKLVRRAQGVAL